MSRTRVLEVEMTSIRICYILVDGNPLRLISWLEQENREQSMSCVPLWKAIKNWMPCQHFWKWSLCSETNIIFHEQKFWRKLAGSTFASNKFDGTLMSTSPYWNQFCKPRCHIEHPGFVLFHHFPPSMWPHTVHYLWRWCMRTVEPRLLTQLLPGKAWIRR